MRNKIEFFKDRMLTIPQEEEYKIDTALTGMLDIVESKIRFRGFYDDKAESKSGTCTHDPLLLP
jgi:hypothetical protein